MKRKSAVSLSKRVSRRDFLRASSIALGPLSIAATNPLPALETKYQAGVTERTNMQEAIRQFLNRVTCRREEVDVFLDPKRPNWARFDPELGYVLRDNILKDGVDGSRTITSYQKSGERTSINYAHRPCRINTYGNSFTQCHQVSDGETWQEYLAAHIGEPIRNFGVGGYGVYQAYRRMLREEAGPLASEYLILNVWGVDDHFRSMDSWRWLRIAEWFRTFPGHVFMFQGNPWVYVRLDSNTGQLIEMEHTFTTPESLYRLTDRDFVYEHFKDDLVVKLLVTEHDGAVADRDELTSWAQLLNVQADLSSAEATAATARAVHLQYALHTGTHIVDKAEAFARANNKKLMVLLSYDSGTVMRACEGQPRADRNFVDSLGEKNILFVDALTKHVQDFKAFKLTPKEYVDRLYNAHYNPQGNHFFAFAIKGALVNWLEPKPPAYLEGIETIPPVV